MIQAEAVARTHRKKQRWASSRQGERLGEALQKVLGLAVQVLPTLLLSLADVLTIPSGLQAACMAALAACGEGLALPLGGCALAALLRLVWGLDLRLGTLAGCALLAGSGRLLHGRGQMWSAGAAAVAMLPQLALACFTGTGTDIALAGASLVMAACLSPVMRRGFTALRSGNAYTQAEEKAGVAALLLLMLCGAGCVRFLGIPAGTAAAGAAAMLAGWKLGLGAGGLCGLLCGVALALGGRGMTLAVCLPLCGVAAGLLRTRDRRWLCAFGAAITACAAVLACGRVDSGALIAFGLAGVTVAAMPDAAAERVAGELRRFMTRRRGMEDHYAFLRLTRWESALRDMAETVPSPQAERGPHTPDWWRAHLCGGCPLREECLCMTDPGCAARAEQVWQARGGTDEQYISAMEGLRGMGCARLFLMREQMMALRREETLLDAERRRLSFRREMVRTHLLAAADTARAFSQAEAGCDWWEAATAQRVSRALSETAFPMELLFARRPEGQVCLGFRETRAFPLRDACAQLRDLMEETLQIPFGEPTRAGDAVVLEELPPWQAEAASLLSPATPGEPCGDTALVLPLPGGLLLAALSDGMGQGERAARQSGETLHLLADCLAAGYTVPQAMKAVNGMMLGVGPEDSYATVDLVLADLKRGRGVWCKLGAGPGWQVERGQAEELPGDAVPLGIVEELAAEVVPFPLRDGLVHVLCSDGVSDPLLYGGASERVMSSLSPASARRAASQLMEATDARPEGCPVDDRSVLVLRFAKRGSGVQRGAADPAGS